MYYSASHFTAVRGRDWTRAVHCSIWQQLTLYPYSDYHTQRKLNNTDSSFTLLPAFLTPTLLLCPQNFERNLQFIIYLKTDYNNGEPQVFPEIIWELLKEIIRHRSHDKGCRVRSEHIL
jgi:hypothetical protein